MKKVFLILMMLIATITTLSAQDEPIEQTARPIIRCEKVWISSDIMPDTFAISIVPNANDPNATIYYRCKMQWDEEKEWQLYSEPFMIGLHDECMIEAYAIAAGKSQSETNLFINYIPTGLLEATFVKDGIFYYASEGSSIAMVGSQYWQESDCYSGDVVLPEVVVNGDETYTVSGIYEYAFKNCENLTSITIPKTIKFIGYGAFTGCYSNLERVIISDLGAWCNIDFDENYNENNGYYPETNPLECAHHLYMNGQEITNLEIPDTVAVVRYRAFQGGHGFITVTIPKSVTEIGKRAFQNCIDLKKVMCKAVTPPVTPLNVFESYEINIYDLATLYVPAEALEAYRAHEEWGRFSRIVPFVGAGPGDVNGDGSIAISDVTNLIDQLLSGEEMPAYIDVNGDGAVTITDVTALIDMLLSGN